VEESFLGTNREYSVKIGTVCGINHNVQYYTNSYEADKDTLVAERKKYGHIIIGNSVWIGSNVYVGCNIWKNSVIGGNSIAAKGLESKAIYSRILAKLVRIVSWKKKTYQTVLGVAKQIINV
jgi:acetyltransferase-like isoleucine patch superfamily enzyme